MKKSLVALAILAVAGVASAQSSVTLFGVVDATLNFGSGSGVGSSDKTQLGNSGNNSSRIGFSGREDLGKGMSASFHLEAGINNDDGSGSTPAGLNNQGLTATGGGLTFGRRSTVSLASAMGELRLGRDVVPQFYNHIIFNPWGPNGVGNSLTFTSSIGGNGLTGIRASNSFGYFLPGNLGGFYGQGMYFLGENVKDGLPLQANDDNSGKGAAIRFGYANGPINVAFGTSRTMYAKTGTDTTGDITSRNLGGSYNFGVARVMGELSDDKVVRRFTTLTGRGGQIGVSAPMGAGEIRAGYSTYKTDAAGTPRSNKYALGYVHNLSKRTALYTTVARLNNNGGASAALNGAVTAANQSSTGYDFGLRHNF